MIGFIGAGNMAGALIKGMIAGGALPGELMALDVNPARAEEMRALGVRIAANMNALREASETVVLAVKPHHAAEALRSLSEGPVREVVSIVVSFSQSALEEALPGARGIARAMPNMPSLVGAGVIAFNENHTIEKERFAAVVERFARCGRTIVVPEMQMGAVTAISGSGPAYAYLFIEALADAGVREGLSREVAYQLAAQTMVGAGRMVLETGAHPGALKDAVCSPGGTTIEAVYALEKAGLRAAVMDAVDACARKAADMAGGMRR